MANKIIARFARQSLVFGHWYANRLKREGSIEDANKILERLAEIDFEIQRVEREIGDAE